MNHTTRNERLTIHLSPPSVGVASFHAGVGGRRREAGSKQVCRQKMATSARKFDRSIMTSMANVFPEPCMLCTLLVHTLHMFGVRPPLPSSKETKRAWNQLPPLINPCRDISPHPPPWIQPTFSPGRGTRHLPSPVPDGFSLSCHSFHLFRSCKLRLMSFHLLPRSI